jgi:hypothetical protein
LRQLESRLDRDGTIDEKTRGGILSQRRVYELLVRIGNRQGGHRIAHLARYPQRLPAGRHDPEVGARSEKLLGQGRAGLHKVFAVVENQQQTPIGNVLDQRVGYGTSCLLLHAKYGCDRLWHQPFIGLRGQLDKPYTVRIVIHHVGRQLQRQTRLAYAAQPKQGQ